jgi:CRP/FNR family cyclic AMP-dependent transcriptional regulator
MYAHTMLGLGLEECPGSERLPLEAGAQLFRCGQPLDWVYLLESGNGKLSRSRSGGEVVFALIRKGELFGEEALLNLPRHILDATALSKSVVLRIPSGAYRRCLEQNPEIARAALRQVSDRLIRMSDWLELLQTQKVGPRLVHVLISLADTMTKTAEGDRVIPLSQSQIAPLVGATRETISHRLNDLARIGLIQLRRRRISIPDVHKLRAYFESDSAKLAQRDTEARVTSA